MRSRRTPNLLAAALALAALAACGSDPNANAGNLAGGIDTAGTTDTSTTFGDVASDTEGDVDTTGSTDDTATGATDATGTDTDGTDGEVAGTDADVSAGDAGCTRDSDCDTLEHGACHVPKCKLDTGVCYIAEEPDDTTCDDGDPCTDEVGVCKAGKCVAAAKACDDGNPCTIDTCDAASGCKQTAGGAGAACDDVNACTKDDACDASGACKGAQIACDDDNACTADSCDPKAGCVNAAADGACDDGDACSEADACKGATCAGTAKVCDDGNPCTADTCDSKDGCKSAAKAGACDDGDACTKDDACDGAGACQKGTVISCDDSNPCTDDSCDAAKGCVNAAKVDGEACDDGTACTKADACKAGKCDATAVDCSDNNPCTKDSCDAKAGCASVVDDTAGCDDEDPCTGSDACKEGKCGGKAIVDCEDNIVCTDDACDPATKTCKHTNNTVSCDDGSLCTTTDACKDGKCQGGTAISCDDKNVCTSDSCDAKSGSCINATNTESCDDGDACSQKDGCKDGKCVGTPVVCDDSNPCTDDSCDAKTGTCAHTKVADDKACDDGSLCTANDLCKAGVCKGTALGSGGVPGCDDGEACTDDSCDPKKGCVAAPNTAKCEDGDACTVGDACKAGKCGAGSAKKDCDDGNACTDDSCDKAKGCISVNAPKACDDGNACTKDDVCTDGKCIGGGSVSCADSNVCTTDKCDPKKGCGNTPNALKCSDSSVCTEGDACKDGKCQAGAAIKCDDGNPCTVDSCDAKTGCKATNADAKAACDDGNSCTSGDACDGKGKCVGVGKDCDDDNACTVDSCANNVCASKPAAAGGACSDDDTCTQKDSCDGKGKCVGANPTKCDDSNPCTDDACVNGQGCKSTANKAACDDGKYCTEGDTCASTKCVSGKAKVCDDGNSCTSDICDETGAKCAAFAKLPNTACDDGNLCTTGDKCNDKSACTATPTACNDENPCTTDACDSKTGTCVFTLGTACTARKIPDIEEIGYLDGSWHLKSSHASVKWQADNTPSAPGSVNGGYSLNFNNGTSFDAKSQVSGTALTKYLYDASDVKGTMTLAFHSYNGVETGTNSYDKRIIELSTDGFVTVAQTVTLDNGKNANEWWLETVDISGLKGKKFQLRFRFDSVDGSNNAGKGWFVDEVSIYAGSVVKVANGGAWDEPFAAGNSAGWHFGAQNGTNASVWAIDKTPSSPGGYDGESLNFNNGTDFAAAAGGTSKAAGWALSPVIDLTGVTTGSVTLLFKSWSQSEELSGVDMRGVAVSALGFGGAPADAAKAFDNAAALQNGWRWEWLDLSAFKGKKVRVRFVFDSINSLNNAYKGWFVDDLRIDNAPQPIWADMVTTGQASNWTINNNQTGPGWAIDNTGIAALSPNASLNFNGKVGTTTSYDYTCPLGKASVAGHATSKAFLLPSSVASGAKLQLDLDAYLSVEASTSWDVATVTVKGLLPIGAPAPVALIVPKTSLGKWEHFPLDVTTLKGQPVQIVISFDSKDCQDNTGTGVAIDNVMVRATK